MIELCWVCGKEHESNELNLGVGKIKECPALANHEVWAMAESPGSEKLQRLLLKATQQAGLIVRALDRFEYETAHAREIGEPLLFSKRLALKRRLAIECLADMSEVDR